MKTVNGFKIVKASGYQVGYTTDSGKHGKGRVWSGWSAVDSEGYSRQFDDRIDAVEFAENYS